MPTLTDCPTTGAITVSVHINNPNENAPSIGHPSPSSLYNRRVAARSAAISRSSSPSSTCSSIIRRSATNRQPAADEPNMPIHTPEQQRAAMHDQHLRSNHISIVSLEDDDDDDDIDEDGQLSSSVVDSDSDVENMFANLAGLAGTSHANAGTNNGMIVINNSTGVRQSGAMNGDIVKTGSLHAGPVLPAAGASERPHIGSIALQNSTDITFGDKTFYQGPVTVKQFFLEKDKWRRQDSTSGGPSAGSFENGSFVPSSGEEDAGQRRNEAGDSSTQHIVNGVSQKYPAEHPSDEKRCWRKLARLEQRPLVLSIIVSLILLFVALLAFVTYLLVAPSMPFSPTSGDDAEFGESLRLIPRIMWLAQPPRKFLNDLVLPATRIIIAHSATAPCETQGACTLAVRLMQTYHMDSMNWDDIGYNFLVGGDGAVYEGRGWDKEGAHTRGFNKASIGIAFIGTFIDQEPPARQLHAARKLIELGLELKKLSPDYRLYGHRQLYATESPGEALYSIIQTWPHWTSTRSGASASASKAPALTEANNNGTIVNMTHPEATATVSLAEEAPANDTG